MKPVHRSLAKRASAALLMVAATQPLTSLAATCKATLPGVNFAGGEFNGDRQPAVYGRDYIFPAAGEIALMKRLDLKLMRVPFLWERLQPKALGPLDPAELARLTAIVDQARLAGLTVVLDPHNYGMYRGVALDRPEAPKGALPDLWKRIAQQFGGDRNVVFGLMNEPKDVDVVAWGAIAKDTLAAIRSTGAPNIVLVPGTHWDGAQSWMDGPPGHSNADVLLPLARDDDAVVFEVHQYFDGNFSGTGETCDAATRVPQILARIGVWAKVNHVRLMLGEFGVSQRPECVKALDDALAVVEEDRDVWYGWTYWAGGAWWGNYPFNVQANGGDTPQGKVLKTRADALATSSCAPGR
jgi:endoglucanase